MDSFMANPTEVLLGYMSTLGRPTDRADFDFGRMAMLLEAMTSARVLIQAGMIVEAAGLEALIQADGMEQRVYALYERLCEWRRTAFMAVPARGSEGEALSPLAWSRDESGEHEQPETDDVDGPGAAGPTMYERLEIDAFESANPRSTASHPRSTAAERDRGRTGIPLSDAGAAQLQESASEEDG